MTTTMIESCLLYNATLRVLICKLCRHALQPNGTTLHYQRHHADVLSLSQRRSLIAYEKSVPQDPAATIKAITFASPLAPIEGLRVVDGCQCLDCDWIAGTEGSAREHGLKGHGWRLGG